MEVEEEAACSSPPAKVARLVSSSGLRTRSSYGHTDLKLCLFCQGVKRDRHNRRQVEKLVRCEGESTPSTLLNAAEVRGDERILVEIRGQDLWAKDVLYHRSCYQAFTSTVGLERLVERALADEDRPQPDSAARERAFASLCQYVQEHTIACPDTVTNVSELCCKFVGFLSEEGVAVSSYRAYMLKTRLRQHFGDELVFHRPEKRNVAEYVFSSKVPVGPLVEKCAKAMEALESTLDDSAEVSLPNSCSEPEETPVCTVFRAALHLRSDILRMDPASSVTYPPEPTHIGEGAASTLVPNGLYNFLAWLFVGDTSGISDSDPLSLQQRVDLKSEADTRQILSVAQDIIHCVTRARIKTPKHVGLPLAVKHMSGSTKLVSLLNRFGHGLSATQVQEVEAGMAHQLLEKGTPAGFDEFVPSNITSASFVQLCWDNNDILEETLTGTGTTHCTNGIAIQRLTRQVALVKQDSMPVSKVTAKSRRRRSIVVPTDTSVDYIPGQREGPEPIQLDRSLLHPAESYWSDPKVSMLSEDFAWLLCRLQSADSRFFGQLQSDQNVPGWSAFNGLLARDDVIRQSVIGYMPVIPASPTEKSTVLTLLKRSLSLADKLAQQEVVVVLDQAIYALAQEVVQKHREQFQRVVLRLGGFHISLTMLAVIGKRFADSGFQSILIESGIVGPSSVKGVMTGKHFNRSVRCHKLVMEALFRLCWQAFESWLEKYQDQQVWLGHDQEHLLRVALDHVRKKQSKGSFLELLSLPAYQQLQLVFASFVDSLKSPLAKLWVSYVQMVHLLLQFLRASRSGNWHLHLLTVRRMLPWMVAYDRVNYTRSLTLYWCEMMALPSIHPSVHSLLADGEFCVQHSSDSPFSQVPVDQSIEQTVNRHTKTKGGIIGFSQRPGAVQQWMVNAHQRAEVTRNVLGMAGMDDQYEEGHVTVHKEAKPTRKSKDEKAVQNVMNLILDWGNPFTASDDEPMRNISSGLVAPEAVAIDMLRAYELGEETLQCFIKDRLLTSSVPFHQPIRTLKLKTFAHTTKTRSMKLTGKEVVVRADRGFFSRLLVIAQSRSMDLRRVFHYSLGPVPWALATVDGQLAKTSKCSLLEALESECKPAECIPDDAAWIIDAMAVLQGISTAPPTFSELAELVFSISTRPFTHGSRRVDFVADIYPEISIKGAEHIRRMKTGGLVWTITSGSQKCPAQWKQFLSVGANKTALMKFLVKEWSQNIPTYAPRLQDHFLFVTCGEACYQLCSPDGSSIAIIEIPELFSTHEEADTRLLLHASHASSQGYENIVIRSPDTDVAVLAVFFSFDIASQLFFRTGARNRARFIDVNLLAARQGEALCRALLGLHAISGCDSTSAFVGRGKKHALGILKEPGNAGARHALASVGLSFHVTDTLFKELEKFVCQLYSSSNQYSSVNELRYSMFCLKAAQSSQLPPCQDCLQQHVLRANYQAGIWFRSLVARPSDVPSPCGHGWKLVDGHLMIQWMNQQPAPAELLELVACGCKTGCFSRRCSCIKASLPCTPACACTNCQNHPDPEEGGESGGEADGHGDSDSND